MSVCYCVWMSHRDANISRLMLSRTNNVCKFVFPHMATTGRSIHQNSTHRKRRRREGGYQPDVELLASQGARKCTTVRERNVETVYVWLTHTSGAICAGDVASRAGADVAAGGVGAFSSVTHAGNRAAFVDVWKRPLHHKYLGSSDRAAHLLMFTCSVLC